MNKIGAALLTLFTGFAAAGPAEAQLIPRQSYYQFNCRLQYLFNNGVDPYHPSPTPILRTCSARIHFRNPLYSEGPGKMRYIACRIPAGAFGCAAVIDPAALGLSAMWVPDREDVPAPLASFFEEAYGCTYDEGSPAVAWRAESQCKEGPCPYNFFVEHRFGCAFTPPADSSASERGVE